MGPLGWQETIFIFVLALIIFGPKKLPELGKTIGKALTEFRRASSELKSTFDREMRSIDTETASVRSEISQNLNDIYSYGSSDYNSNYSGEYSSDHSNSSTHENPSTVGALASSSADSGASENGGATESPEGASSEPAADPGSEADRAAVDSRPLAG